MTDEEQYNKFLFPVPSDGNYLFGVTGTYVKATLCVNGEVISEVTNKAKFIPFLTNGSSIESFPSHLVKSASVIIYVDDDKIPSLAFYKSLKTSVVDNSLSCYINGEQYNLIFENGLIL